MNIHDVYGNNTLYTLTLTRAMLVQTERDKLFEKLMYGDGALDGDYVKLTFVFSKNSPIEWVAIVNDAETFEAGEALCSVISMGERGKRPLATQIIDTIMEEGQALIIVHLGE